VRLVYYSLANFPDDSRERQWIQSIRSLRRYNPSIPVWLLLFNGASPELLREAEQRDVRVQLLGDYQEFLRHILTALSWRSIRPFTSFWHWNIFRCQVSSNSCTSIATPSSLTT
jgi:hypothetical protein